MTLKNKLGEWMHGNKTWTIPQTDGEGFIVELENNSLVMGLMDGKSLCTYRGFSPYATFGTWQKVALAKNRISKIFILCTQ